MGGNMDILAINEKMNPELPQETFKNTCENAEVPPQKWADAQRVVKDILNGNEEATRALTEHINEFLQTMNYSLKFIPEKDGKEIVIKVLDGQGNLVRRIPPDAMTALSEHLSEDIGLIINKILE